MNYRVGEFPRNDITIKGKAQDLLTFRNYQHEYMHVQNMFRTEVAI